MLVFFIKLSVCFEHSINTCDMRILMWIWAYFVSVVQEHSWLWNKSVLKAAAVTEGWELGVAHLILSHSRPATFCQQREYLSLVDLFVKLSFAVITWCITSSRLSVAVISFVQFFHQKMYQLYTDIGANLIAFEQIIAWLWLVSVTACLQLVLTFVSYSVIKLLKSRWWNSKLRC